MPDSNVKNVNGENNNVESTTKKDELRVKNVSELNEDSNPSTSSDDPARNKRKLPAWMLTANSSNKGQIEENDADADTSECKRLKTDECQKNNDQSNGGNAMPDIDKDSNTSNNNADAVEAPSSTGSFNIKKEPPEMDDAQNTADSNVNVSINGANEAKVKDEPTDADDTAPSAGADDTVTSAGADDTAASASADNTAASTSADDTVASAGADDTVASAGADDTAASTSADDAAASTSAGVQNPTDVKPAVKVEKADASSTSRESCKYGIRCYRRNPMHRIEEAHPGDHDYKRPSFPLPPLGTPACPFGNMCYRRNPTHFQQYSHPADTDFQKNYRLRQRRRQQQQQPNNADDDNSDLDDYDLDDPFINDDSDLDYVPSDDNIDDTEELDYDDCDKAEE